MTQTLRQALRQFLRDNDFGPVRAICEANGVEVESDSYGRAGALMVVLGGEEFTPVERAAALIQLTKELGGEEKANEILAVLKGAMNA